MSGLTPQQQQSLSIAQARAAAANSGAAASRGDPAGPLPASNVPANAPDTPTGTPPDALDNYLQLLGVPHSNGAAKAAIGGAANTATFGFADEGSAAIKSAVTGEPYDQALGEYRANEQASKDAHPIAYAGGQIAGAVPTLAIPGAGAADAGASLIGNVGRGIVAGGTMGAVYGAGNATGDIGDRARSAVNGTITGALAGGAVPIAGRLVGSGIRTVASAFSPVDLRSANLVARAASDDGLQTGADVQGALTNLGPNAMPADLGPNLQRQAGAVAATPGSGQAVVRDALASRSAGANARIQGDVNAMLGPAPVPSQVAATIKTNQAALGPAYRAVLANAKAVDTTALANDLDSQATNTRGSAQKAITSVRGMLNVPGTDQLDPHPGALLATRQAIDGMLATEADPNTIRVLTAARSQVDQALTTAAPGIKAVDAKYAELASQGEAFKTGETALNETTHPQDLADQMATGATPKGAAVGPSAVPFQLSQGARAQIDQIIGNKANNVTALQGVIKGDGSWNRDKLVTLFGSDKADQIIGVLNREKTFADTAKVVTGNSETAARLAAQGEVAPSPQAGVVRALLTRPWDVPGKIGDAVAGGVTSARRAATTAAVAKLLTTTGQQPTAATMEVAAALLRRQQSKGVENAANMALTPLARGGTPALAAGGQQLIDYARPGPRVPLGATAR